MPQKIHYVSSVTYTLQGTTVGLHCTVGAYRCLLGTAGLGGWCYMDMVLQVLQSMDMTTKHYMDLQDTVGGLHGTALGTQATATASRVLLWSSRVQQGHPWYCR